ncbi:hypothetical protein [Pontibacter russatus]|uniref:hypothetical protein n=1 Tax=Pontibacter russatus TaxID=2694929 RepID=UPI00137A98C6|nr:hypothetical protein [Pontibacter russatus]
MKIPIKKTETTIIDRVVWNWVFIHYCGQIIGQWQKKYVYNGLANVLASQVSISTSAIPVFIFLLLGGKSHFWGAILVMGYILSLQVLLKKPLMQLVDLKELERAYQQISRQQRIRKFILAVVMFVFSFFISIASYKVVGAIL